eukprot:CAMPEP_0171908906 /NCGR_PEP_ID=MMETSP0993-20121228/8297_1 /TAXON_ID=483369 /ORGANISM="non described non described, Strain CCMP2098" /LENGTH=112 /DNA_ID=CAMNT_0012541693 /DNA_START=130 /DNA_END=465 /DNA_ORIENTATION=+
MAMTVEILNITEISEIESSQPLPPSTSSLEAWDHQYVADAGVPDIAQLGVLEMSRVIECCGKGVTEPLCDPLTLLRFFNSRENVVEDAVGMYRETVAWRESFGIARIMKDFG